MSDARDDGQRLQKAQEILDRAAAEPQKLDMTRGKPAPEQLDLAVDLMNSVDASSYQARDGQDTRNYGGLLGLPEARELFGAYLELPAESVLVQDNSSLRLMHDAVAEAMLRGVPGGERAWCREERVRFLCPSPGYDRHFFLLAQYGIELIPVEMNDVGPDMEAVQRLVAADATVKGMFCVPRYSNPTGIVYSDEVIDALASMPSAAADFRIFWDNAYMRHHLVDDPQPLKCMVRACEAAGNPDRVLLFGSTSKITLAGGGVSLAAGSAANIEWWKTLLGKQSIGPDKVNQLRHVRFFGDLAGIDSHMAKHAELLRPKFAAVQEELDAQLGGADLAEWTRPEGGYFISLDVPDGCASRVVARAASVGLKLTPSGATYPHGDDPRDRNIRLAPSFPQVDEVRQAARIVAAAVVVEAAAG